jgi:glycosyltransferase involved in cell wall biosynthesis
MKFSIIIPVYNIQDYINTAIDSVLNQDYSNYEMILVDDGSKDKSASICDKYADKYRNIKVIHKKNGGLSSARNQGILAATGDYIIFLDGDDFLSSSSLRNFNDIIEKNPNVDIITGKLIKYYKDNQYTTESFQYKENYSYIKGIDVLEKLFEDIPVIIWSACRSIYRREFIVENSFYFKEGITSEDLELVPRIFVKANCVAFNNEPFYYYRLGRNNSIINTVSKKRFIDIILIIEDYIGLLKNDSIISGKLKKLFMVQLANIYARYLVLINELPKDDQKEIYNAMFKINYILKYSTSLQGRYLKFANRFIKYKIKIKVYHILKVITYKIRHRINLLS